MGSPSWSREGGPLVLLLGLEYTRTAFHAVPRSSKKTKFQVPKTKAEKPVQKLDQPEEIEVDEVVIEAAEPTAKAETQGKVHAHAAESLVETINHHQQKTIIKPRSLKVLNAYEQCKLECKKQRDSVQAQEYVEQLRAELAAAEQALAEETAAAANVAEPTLQ
ncbi:unnamed protein product [Heligmosomoides polygyrus]|uniref:Uncharacterized protein n=1 Tax=Heligmosomoides polygyrus TaxID=6339 RepID=A0A183GLC7_HELPZ|nr:unnamed protein product [Heligmosomoides polygyrus]